VGDGRPAVLERAKLLLLERGGTEIEGAAGSEDTEGANIDIDGGINGVTSTGASGSKLSFPVSDRASVLLEAVVFTVEEGRSAADRRLAGVLMVPNVIVVV
jgi:hypothetical protein